MSDNNINPNDNIVKKRREAKFRNFDLEKNLSIFFAFQMILSNFCKQILENF